MSKITDATEALRWVVSDECEADDTITILATEVSALRARLAAAEARAERAVGLLVLCRPLVSTIRVGNVDPQSAHGGDQTAYAIDALLKEVADGR